MSSNQTTSGRAVSCDDAPSAARSPLAAVLLIALIAAGLGPACSVKKMAVNRLGDALAGGGETFAADEDPELVKAAVPFSLKLIESLLAESPRHKGLFLAAASGFTQYAYAFVQQDADELEDADFAAATAMRLRARKLYLRARNYGLRGCDTAHPGFSDALRRDPKAAVQQARAADVPLLYWTGAAWAAAISLGKDDPDLVADLPIVEAMMDRALVLDPNFGEGSLQAFMITFAMGRAAGGRNPETEARQHFESSLRLSGGQQAGPFVSLAEAVSVQTQNLAEFRSLLEQALAVDVDARPEWRLANLVAQRRARWLLARADELFLTADSDEETDHE